VKTLAVWQKALTVSMCISFDSIQGVGTNERNLEVDVRSLSSASRTNIGTTWSRPCPKSAQLRKMASAEPRFGGSGPVSIDKCKLYKAREDEVKAQHRDQAQQHQHGPVDNNLYASLLLYRIVSTAIISIYLFGFLFVEGCWIRMVSCQVGPDRRCSHRDEHHVSLYKISLRCRLYTSMSTFDKTRTVFLHKRIYSRHVTIHAHYHIEVPLLIANNQDKRKPLYTCGLLLLLGALVNCG
jgi:hypothetical protein